MSCVSTTEPLRFDRGQRRQTIVESVLSEVFHGRFRAGQHLVTQDLADQFGVSHTPIREALVALAGIGVVDLTPNRGAVVRRVSARDVREVCQVRRALECEAARGACGRIDAVEMESLAAELKTQMTALPNPSSQFVVKARDVDSRLHDLIAVSCGNALLTSEIGRLKILFRAYRDLAWDRHGDQDVCRRLVEEGSQHLAIVEALLADDGRAAYRAMSRHIVSSMKYWYRAVQRSAEESR